MTHIFFNRIWFGIAIGFGNCSIHDLLQTFFKLNTKHKPKIGPKIPQANTFCFKNNNRKLAVFIKINLPLMGGQKK